VGQIANLPVFPAGANLANGRADFSLP
jgi:hypothetical protein